MCQSSARGRCRLLRHPSLVRLIAPARHLPLPPAPPIQSPSRGEERAGGEKREAPAPSYFATHRLSCRRRERRRGSAAPGRGGREGEEPWLPGTAGRSLLALARPNFDQLVEYGAGSQRAARSPGRAEAAARSRSSSLP